jgi:stage V sporulation protein G
MTVSQQYFSETRNKYHNKGDLKIMDKNTALDVRVYPIDEPKGKTLAFASVSIGDIAAMRSIRVVQGAERPYVAMPKSKDKSGGFHDLTCPLVSDLRKDLNAAVLSEWEKQAALTPEERGYEKFDYNKENLRKPGELIYSFDVKPISKPKGNTLAYASATLDDTVAINSIRVYNSENGLRVSMPQSKDRNGGFHDVAFPLNGDIRKALCADIIEDYQQKAAEMSEKKQGIGEKLAAGAQKVADLVASAAPAPVAPAMSAAKRGPGLGD